MHPIAKYVSFHRLSQNYTTFTSNLSSVLLPKTIQEALGHTEWRTTIIEEMQALKKNGTWEIVELARDKKTVARLVAKGFTQTYKIDYQETFAPVAKVNSIRVLLSLAANLSWPMHQLVMKNVFLNVKLEEEVFMDLPLGFESVEYNVCIV